MLANLGSNFSKNECKGNCLQNRKIAQNVARITDSSKIVGCSKNLLANLVAIYNVTNFTENCLLKCITKTGSIKDNKFRKRNKNQRKGNFKLLSLLGNYMCISFTVKLMMLSLNVDFCGCSKRFSNAFVESVYFKISSCQYLTIIL